MRTPRTGRTVGIIIVISNFLLFTLKVDCVPLSPCPMNFHYEYDGQEWIGVVKIHPQIYNQFRMDHIRVNVVLASNRLILSAQNFYLLPYKTQDQIYLDIAARQPIQYRVTFPSFRNEFPELRSIIVNGLQVCQNRMPFRSISDIKLQYTFHLPKIDSIEDPLSGAYGSADAFDFKLNAPKPAITTGINNVPQLIMQLVDNNENGNADAVDHMTMQNPRWQNLLRATTSECGTYDEQLKYTQLISGGNKIIAGTWPWLVAIFRKDSKASNLVFQCTGSLISHHLVLTAAHCFKMDSRADVIAAKKIVLAFGRHDIRDWTEKNMRISDAEEIILHADYLSKRDATIFEADIALVLIKDFITYTEMIRPICLWPTTIDSSISMIGTNGTLVGWGQPFENVDENVPRKLTFPIVRNEQCFPTSVHVAANSWNVFCAGTERRGYAPCGGDSGSAFAIYANGAWFLRGITSAARGDPILNRCELNTYAIFTDTIHYRTWIDQYM